MQPRKAAHPENSSPVTRFLTAPALVIWLGKNSLNKTAKKSPQKGGDRGYVLIGGVMYLLALYAGFIAHARYQAHIGHLQL